MKGNKMEILALGGTEAMGRSFLNILGKTENAVTVTSRSKRENIEKTDVINISIVGKEGIIYA